MTRAATLLLLLCSHAAQAQPLPRTDNGGLRLQSATPSTVNSDYVDVSAIRRRVSQYRTSGSKVLRPSSITEDGQRTYIIWPRERDLPATYEIDASGREVLTNGMMRDDVFVIDRVVARLAFRRDDLVARAEHVQPRKRRR